MTIGENEKQHRWIAHVVPGPIMPVSKYNVVPLDPPLTPSMRANLMSSEGFQCLFLWFMNQLFICFWSRPVISASFTFSTSWNKTSFRYLTINFSKICWLCNEHNRLKDYRWVGPSVVSVPPVQQCQSSVLGQLTFLPFLQEFLPETAQIPTILFKKHFLQFMVGFTRTAVLGFRCLNIPTARLLFRGSYSFIWTKCAMRIRTVV